MLAKEIYDNKLILKNLDPTSEKHMRLVSGFNCGSNDILSDYIQGDAFSDDLEGDGKTHLILDKHDQLIAYYTLRATSITVEDQYVPVVEISRLAVEYDYQGKNIGTIMFFCSICRDILAVKNHIGVKAILVFAEDDKGKHFYSRFGFEEFASKDDINILNDSFRDECTAMILKIDDLFISKVEQYYSEIMELGFLINGDNE